MAFFLPYVVEVSFSPPSPSILSMTSLWNSITIHQTKHPFITDVLYVYHRVQENNPPQQPKYFGQTE